MTEKRFRRRIISSALLLALIIIQVTGDARLWAAEAGTSVSDDAAVSENDVIKDDAEVSEDAAISENIPQSEDVDQKDGNESEGETVSGPVPETSDQIISENTAEEAEPVGADTISSGTCGEEGGNITWTITGNPGDYTLSFNGTGQMKDYIGDTGADAPPWLEKYGNAVTNVTFSGSITSLGSRACLNFESLEKIELPDSLEKIGSYAFEGCTGLSNLSIGKNLAEIGFGAMRSCTGLEVITVDPDNAVYSDGNGNNVLITKQDMVLIKGSNKGVVPAGVTEIGDEAFSGCAGLKECVLPAGVTEIGEGAFSGCTSLTEITLPDSVTALNNSVFYFCENLERIKFSENLTSIPAQSLFGCRSLKSVNIPAGVTEIGNSAFEECRVLENINIPAGVSVIPNGCFRNCVRLKKIKVPEGVTKIEGYAFSFCRYLSVLGLPKSLAKVEGGAFETASGDGGSKVKPIPAVYYAGDENEWASVVVEWDNDALKNANIIYNAVIPDNFGVASVSVDETDYTLETGCFAVLRADAHPFYADNVSFTWSSTNLNVASVDQSGKVTALSPGTADITVTEPGGKKAVCHLKVVDSADDKSLSWGLNTDWMFIPGNSVWAGQRVRSYMFRQGSGYCTLRYEPRYHDGVDFEGIIFSRYDAGHNLIYKREIPMELPLWGGFYADDDAYYIVTGQENDGESSEVECFRVTKYDHDWNRLGSAPLFECNTVSPFGFGSLRMAKKGDYIIVRTCHIMYMTSDGLCHQSNVTFLYDTKKMEICDDMMEVDSRALGYVSHSFNQFVGIDSDGLVMLDHGDGSPRSFVLNKSYQDISQGYLESDSKFLHLMEFPGVIGDNETGAVINGFAIGKNRYIAAGCSVVQDEKNTERHTYNVFVSTTDKDLTASNLNWLTSANEGERSYQPPQLAKMSDDRFLILWQRKKSTRTTRDPEYIVYYTEINENGERVTPIYHHKGELSDCVPIVEDGKVQWFTCNDKQVDFYGISTADITKFSVNGTESDSGIDEPGGGDDGVEVTGVTLNVHNATLYPKETLKLSAVVSPSDAANRSVSFNSSDPSVATVDLSGEVTAVSAGNAVITVTTVSGGKKDSMTLKVLRSEVADEDEDNNSPERNAGVLWVSGLKESYYYTGYAIKPEIRVYRGEKRLKEKTDYTISFKNNVKVTPAGAADSKKARITVKLKGNYKGTKSFYYTILPMPLSELTAEDSYAKYTKGAKNDSIRPVLSYKGNAIKYSDRDITLGYFQGDSKSGCEEKGEYIIKITAGSTGSFTGSTAAKLTVADMTPISKVKVANLEKTYKYTGDPVIPDIELKDGNSVLSEGNDYTVSLENNVEIGRAVMTISGCGANYIGKRRLKFDIKGKYTLSEDDVNFAYGDGRSCYAYGGAKPEVIVTFRGKRLRKNIDYQVSYKYNKKLRSVSDEKPPQAVIKGKGSYRTAEKTGIIKAFSIEPASIPDLVLVISDRAYSKNKNDYRKTKILFTDENFRDQKLKKGKANDYTVSFSVSDGSAAPKTGERITVSINAGSKGNYIGNTSGSFRIIDPKQDIGKAEVKVNGGKACPYTGKSIEPGGEGEPGLELVMKNKTLSNRLEKGTDYEILGYYNNINKGKGVILLRGKGKYRGVRTVRFSIRASNWGEINKGITYNKKETASSSPSSDRR